MNSKNTLQLFQTENNRKIEEDFASILSEKNNLRLFFINENQAYTDGRNIVVDPANDNLYSDKIALRKTEEFMNLPNITSEDEFIALKMITRAQNIHETLHIIYTNFPLDCLNDPRATTKYRKMVLSSIANIIEDCYIEAVGASEYDNLAMYLVFGRVSRLFANTPSEGTIQRAFERFATEDSELTDNEKENHKKNTLLMEFLDYFATMLLYPMIELEEPSIELKQYIDKTKEYFLEGSICGNPVKRYSYTSKIFDEIETLLADIEDDDINQYNKFSEFISEIIGDEKTHSGKQLSINNYKSNGKEANITRKLFTSLDGKPSYKSFIQQFQLESKKFLDEKNSSIAILGRQTITINYTGKDLKANAMHSNIKLEVTYPKPNLNMKKAYDNVLDKYKLNINSYNTKFTQLLKGNVESYESKYVYGTGIDAKRLGDIKKRYWYRKTNGIDVPDVSILFLIDGSGSMNGPKRSNAIKASVILHEVLSKNGIEHAIVEHRAIFDEPLVQHKILIDFSNKEYDKYNILLLDAEEGTREGLSLMWAKKYLQESTHSEKKIIISISDGYPCHNANDNDDYTPPISIKDTHNSVIKIEKEGIDIIAVALENDVADTSCYEALSEIYNRVIEVNDLKHLTTQLLNLISKLFI